MNPNVFTICPDYRNINMRLFLCILSVIFLTNYFTTLKEYLRFFWSFRKNTNISDAKVCKVLPRTISGTLKTITGRIWSLGFVSGTLLRHERRMTATTNNCFFRNKETRHEEARNVLCNVWPRPEITCGVAQGLFRTKARQQGPGPGRPLR
jgi:hypothetical protein